MGQLLHEELSGKVIGAGMEVHSQLGPGFLESVYEEALAHELQLRNVSFERQKPLPVYYKEKLVKEFVCDFWIGGKILVEIKAVRQITKNEEAQLNELPESHSFQTWAAHEFWRAFSEV